jgi:hypothetical protein
MSDQQKTRHTTTTLWTYHSVTTMVYGFLDAMLERHVDLATGETFSELGGLDAVDDEAVFERAELIVRSFIREATEAGLGPDPDLSSASIGRKLFFSASGLAKGSFLDEGSDHGEALHAVASMFTQSMDEQLMITATGRIRSLRSFEDEFIAGRIDV